MIFNFNNFTRIFHGANKKAQVLFLLDGIVINGAYVLTMGIILSGYALYLGAGDFLTALLNSCASYATIVSLFSFVVYERISKKKELLLGLNLASRFLMFLIVFVPLIFDNSQIKFISLTVLAVLSEVIWGIYRIGWTIWMMNVIPKETKSDFVYMRMFLIRLFMSIITLASGFVLDAFNKGYLGFLILFSLSFALSLYDVVILKKIEYPEPTASENEKVDLKMFLQPVLFKEFRSFLTFIFLFYLCLTMATSFTPIYLIKYLNLDYKLISTINVISQMAMVASNLFWGRIEKVKGFKFVLCITAFFTAGELLILSFVTRDTWLLLFFSSIIAGIGMGGFGVSILTYRYEIMPEKGKTIFEGWFYFSFGLGVLIAPFAGKMLIDLLPALPGVIFTSSKIQLLYLTAFLLLCILLFITFLRPRTVTKSTVIEKEATL